MLPIMPYCAYYFLLGCS